MFTIVAVVTQFYITEAENVYVIRSNAAVMKCKIPSFVADFVQVEAWIDVEDGTELMRSNDSSETYGDCFFFSNSTLRPPFCFCFRLFSHYLARNALEKKMQH